MERFTVTLLDAQAPKPPNRTLRYTLALLLPTIILGALLIIKYHNYYEERTVARFLTTLHEGDYQEAYRLWKPSPSYTFEDFLLGWGEQGDYGVIREFQILASESKGSNSVIVTVRINNVDPPLDLVVDRETKGLAYSPF